MESSTWIHISIYMESLPLHYRTLGSHSSSIYTKPLILLIMSMNEAQAGWRGCLASAFRTALACTIVGCTTLYGPAFLQRQIPFPAFSYVTAILIVSTDATLGDTLRGCWLALYATAQIVGPAILCLWLIGPAMLSSLTTALAVALCAFVVALPEYTHLVAKRIALGQSVILYVKAFIDGAKTEAIMHPVHVAASTAVGALASLLALLLPYPRLASYEVINHPINPHILKIKGKNVIILFPHLFVIQ
jgi:hypothetical protein